MQHETILDFVAYQSLGEPQQIRLQEHHYRYYFRLVHSHRDD